MIHTITTEAPSANRDLSRWAVDELARKDSYFLCSGKDRLTVFDLQNTKVHKNISSCQVV